VRNSSLVKRRCADNGTGLKHTTEIGNSCGSGRGALWERGKAFWQGTLERPQVRMQA
jgi:hypothetical protein